MFVAGIAAELAPAVLGHGAWSQIVAWLLLIAATVGVAVNGTIEVTRLTPRLRRSPELR